MLSYIDEVQHDAECLLSWHYIVFAMLDNSTMVNSKIIRFFLYFCLTLQYMIQLSMYLIWPKVLRLICIDIYV